MLKRSLLVVGEQEEGSLVFLLRQGFPFALVVTITVVYFLIHIHNNTASLNIAKVETQMYPLVH